MQELKTFAGWFEQSGHESFEGNEWACIVKNDEWKLEYNLYVTAWLNELAEKMGVLGQ